LRLVPFFFYALIQQFFVCFCQDFRDSLASEEKRRQEAVAAVESEKRIVSHLHQDLANQRATAYEDVLNLKNK